MCLSAVKLDHNGELSGLIELIECADLLEIRKKYFEEGSLY